MTDKHIGSYSEGGWGWIIVLAGFTVMFIFYGSLKAFGVLLTSIQEDFDTELWLIGSIGSLQYGLLFGLGPVAGAVAHKIGSRCVVTFGGIMFGLGFLLASMANSVILLGASLILVAGTGAGCVYETCRVELVFYFQEKFPVAIFLVALGGPVGMMLYGPLTQVLMETYGWRGTMLLLGGVSFHIMICGLVMRPDKHNTKEYNKVTLIGVEDVHYPKRGTSGAVNCFHKFLRITGLDIFQNIELIIVSCARMFINIGYAGVIVYIVPHGLSLGLSTTEASFIITAWGVGNIFGLALSTFIHNCAVSNHLVALIAGLVSVVSYAASPFFTTFTGQLFIITLLGVGVDGVAQVIAVTTRNLPFTDDRQFNISGWQCFMVGVSCSVGDVIAGWLYDATGGFHATFFMFSGTTAVVCVCFLMDLVRRWYIGQPIKLLSM